MVKAKKRRKVRLMIDMDIFERSFEDLDRQHRLWRLWLCLYAHANMKKQGESFASSQTLMKMSGVDYKHYYALMAELVERGMLIKGGERSRGSTYYYIAPKYLPGATDDTNDDADIQEINNKEFEAALKGGQRCY